MMRETPTSASSKKKAKGGEKGSIIGTARPVPAPHDGVSHAIELLGKTPKSRKLVDHIVIRTNGSFDDSIYFYLIDGSAIEMLGNQYEAQPSPGLKFSFLDDGIAILRHTQVRCRSQNSQFDTWFKQLHQGIDALTIVVTAENEGHDFKGKTGAITTAAGLSGILESVPTYRQPLAGLLPREEILFLLDFIDFLISSCRVQHQMLSDIGQASKRCRAKNSPR